PQDEEPGRDESESVSLGQHACRLSAKIWRQRRPQSRHAPLVVPKDDVLDGHAAENITRAVRARLPWMLTCGQVRAGVDFPSSGTVVDSSASDHPHWTASPVLLPRSGACSESEMGGRA